MSGTSTFLIVGGGEAGAHAAATLRAEGFSGRIVLIGEETHLPYNRPPLSKSFLNDRSLPEFPFIFPESFYHDKAIETRLGVKAVEINADRSALTLADGETLHFDKLLLATGARNRKLQMPGCDLDGVNYLRTYEESLRIRSALRPGMSIVVVGGGYIGLEVAAASRKMGCCVTVIEYATSLLARGMDPKVGKFFEEIHRGHGVEVYTGTTVSELRGEGHVSEVLCSDGRSFVADVVIVGIGVIPSTELAETAGLVVDDGIVVDEYGRTSDERIFAAGDVSNHPNSILARRLRLESWQNAQNQAITTAKNMSGAAEPYAEIPWFWTDQYDLNMQMIGIPNGWDAAVVRGNPASRKFTVFYLQQGRIEAAVAFNSPRDIPVARKAIANKVSVDANRLQDESNPLRSALAP